MGGPRSSTETSKTTNPPTESQQKITTKVTMENNNKKSSNSNKNVIFSSKTLFSQADPTTESQTSSIAIVSLSSSSGSNIKNMSGQIKSNNISEISRRSRRRTRGGAGFVTSALRLLVAAFAITGVDSLAVPAAHKVNARQMTLAELESTRGSRIAPQAQIRASISRADDDNLSSLRQRRVTRDTLLNLYRKKSLYESMSRDLVQAYYQSSAHYQPISAKNFQNHKLQYTPKTKNQYQKTPVVKRYPGLRRNTQIDVAAASSGNTLSDEYSRQRRDQLEHVQHEMEESHDSHVLSEEDRRTLRTLKAELASEQALRL